MMPLVVAGVVDDPITDIVVIVAGLVDVVDD